MKLEGLTVMLVPTEFVPAVRRLIGRRRGALASTKGRYLPGTVGANLPGFSRPPVCRGRPVNVQRNGLAKTSLK